MQTWCFSMGGRAPRVMLTDQDNAIKATIVAIFPDTQHCFNLWNILEKIPRQLDCLNLWHDTFMAKFNKCMNRSWTEEQFEKRWWKLIERSNLREDEWIHSLYEDRKFWVPSFMRDVSFAGLSAASRSENFNSFFDKYISVETSLRDFLEKYRIVPEDRYEEQAKANFYAWHEIPELKSPSPFEKQMSQVYTHEIFKKFQDEVLGADACHLKKEKEEDKTVTYTVKDFKITRTLQWNGMNRNNIFTAHVIHLNRQGIFVNMLLWFSKCLDLPCTLEYPALYPRGFTAMLRSCDMTRRSLKMLSEMLEEDR